MKTSKSLIALLLAAIIAAGCCVTAFAAYADENNSGEYYFAVGDVNMDYILNAADARRILRVAAKMDKFYPQPDWVESKDRMLGDADFDGKVTANDARLVLRMAAGLLTVTQLYESVRARQARNAPPTYVAPVTQPAPATTKAPFVPQPLNGYYLKATVKQGGRETHVTAAVSGGDFYISVPEISEKYSVLSKSGEYYIFDSENKTYYKSGSYLGLASSLVKSLSENYSFEIRDFSNLKELETVTEDGYTVVTMPAAKYYLNSKKELAKIELFNDTSAVTTIEVDEFSSESAKVTAAMSVPDGYTEQSFVQFSETFSFLAN